MSDGVLVAGIGNIFLGDDGFGPEVVVSSAGVPSRCPNTFGWLITASVACTWRTTC